MGITRKLSLAQRVVIEVYKVLPFNWVAGTLKKLIEVFGGEKLVVCNRRGDLLARYSGSTGVLAVYVRE